MVHHLEPADALRAALVPFALVAYVVWELPRAVARSWAARRRLRQGPPRFVVGRS